MQEEGKVLDGVGKDAEIVTNEQGGKQSKAPMAMHLIDAQFLRYWALDEAIKLECCQRVDVKDKTTHGAYTAIADIADFMQEGTNDYLDYAINHIEPDSLKAVTRIAKVLQYGASRYAPNNWRLIPQEEHINHALIHIIAHLAGDTQDEHLDHALCRLMMAMATSTSPNFSYTDYVLPRGEEVESKLEL